MAPKKKEQTKSSQSQNEGGVRKSSRIMGLAPSCSETTVSDNRTGMAKVVNPKPKPKQARKSEKRPTNNNRDWVDDLSVEPPMSQAEEALMDKLRADFEQRRKDTSRAEASTAAGERAEKPDETHLQTEVRVETEVHEESIKSPSKLIQIGKRRKANHGSSLFNFINIQHKQSNPHQKLSQTVRYEFSQKWRQLPPDEKEKYKVEPKVKEDCVGSEEAVELFSLNTRCSPERFRSVVSEFTDAQKVACEELGFGVLVRMAGKRLRKCTVRYLVECVDPTTCEIKIHGQTFKLSSDDFARVMGLRNAGRELSFAGSVKDNPKLMGIAQQFRTKEGKSMMVLRDLKNYLRDKTAPVDDKFKRVFVLYTMGTILTPSASLMIPQKWLLPLRDTQAIASFNWCEHAFKLLMKGISVSSRNIFFCLLSFFLLFPNITCLIIVTRLFVVIT
ncbi:hypothetical protein ACLB2K_073408 [Fragaria x ananassa]